MRAWLARCDGRRECARLCAAATLLLSGCQSMQLTAANAAQLRVMHVSPDVGAVDAYQNATALAYSMSFGSVTTYVPMTPGVYALSAERTGSRQVLAASSTVLQAGRQYTLLIGNVNAALQQTVVVDKSQPAAAGQAEIRLLDEVTRGGAVDVYLVPPGGRVAGMMPAVAGMVFGGNGGYVPVPVGRYAVVVLPAGSTGTPLLSGAQVNYESGSVHTVVLIDTARTDAAKPVAVQALVATDVDGQ